MRMLLRVNACHSFTRLGWVGGINVRFKPTLVIRRVRSILKGEISSILHDVSPDAFLHNVAKNLSG